MNLRNVRYPSLRTKSGRMLEFFVMFVTSLLSICYVRGFKHQQSKDIPQTDTGKKKRSEQELSPSRRSEPQRALPHQPGQQAVAARSTHSCSAYSHPPMALVHRTKRRKQIQINFQSTHSSLQPDLHDHFMHLLHGNTYGLHIPPG